MSEVHKDRLIRFYTHYAPEKLSNVDAALRSFAGREEYMFDTLVKKYGPEPAARSSTTATSASGAPPASTPRSAVSPTADYKGRLTRFLHKYEPEKLSKVDDLLAKSVGKEEQLFAKLVAKYGPEPDAAGASAANSDYWRQRLTQFLQARAPDKVSSVDALLTKFQGQEEQLMNSLVKKFGPEPQQQHGGGGGGDSVAVAAAAAATQSTAVPSSSSPSGHRERLVRFYQRHAPEKVAGVDVALEKFAGREEYMFEALVKKYGPEPEAHAPEVVASGGTGAAAPGSSGGTAAASSTRQRIERLLEARAPEKLAALDSLMSRFEGREDELLAALVKKLGPEPTTAGSSDSQRAVSVTLHEDQRNGHTAPPCDSRRLTTEQWRARLERYLQARAPDRLGSVDAMLVRYKGKEDEMMRALVGKLGPEPTDDHKTPAVSAPPSPEKFTAKGHVTAMLSPVTVQTLQRQLRQLWPTGDSDIDASTRAVREEFFFAVLMVAELCNFADPDHAFAQLPREPTDVDRRAFALVSAIWDLKAMQVEEEASIIEAEESALNDLARKAVEDHSRVGRMAVDRMRHRQLVLAKALDMIDSVESDQRREVEEEYRLTWLGQAQWFREQRERVLLCTPPPQLQILEEKMVRWRQMVREGEEEMHRWAASKQREQHWAPHGGSQLLMWGGSTQNNGITGATARVRPGSSSQHGRAVSHGSARLLSRGLAGETLAKVKSYGTADHPMFPSRTATPRWEQAQQLSPHHQPSGSARTVLITDNGKFVSSPVSSRDHDSRSPIHRRQWNQHVPLHEGTPPRQAKGGLTPRSLRDPVDRSGVKLPPKLHIPPTTPAPFSLGTPRRPESARLL